MRCSTTSVSGMSRWSASTSAPVSDRLIRETERPGSTRSCRGTGSSSTVRRVAARRSLPSAQPVEEVADVMIDAIDRPRVDVYTRPGAQQMVVDYFAAPDMAVAEEAIAVRVPAPAR